MQSVALESESWCNANAKDAKDVRVLRSTSQLLLQRMWGQSRRKIAVKLVKALEMERESAAGELLSKSCERRAKEREVMKRRSNAADARRSLTSSISRRG